MQISWVGPNSNKDIDDLQNLGPNSKGVRLEEEEKVADQRVQVGEGWSQGSLKLREAQPDTGCRWLAHAVCGGWM